MALITVSACSSSSSPSSTGASSAADKPLICVDYPRSDTDFWNAFIAYVPKYAKEMGLNIKTTNSANNVQKLVANVQACISQGAKAIVMAPQDTAAIGPTLDQLSAKKIPVVSLDTRPDTGAVFMVVRANNVALGEQACKYLGAQMKGAGTAVELMGGQDSINGRDRRQGFGDCMKANYPNIKVTEEASNWSGAIAASQLQTAMAADKNVKGVYMASSFALAGTIQVLKQNKKDVPATDPNHVFIASNDGIPQEYADIKAGTLDATVSQPADLYAKFGLFYANAAIEGKTFPPGASDHTSNILQVRSGLLEDQLSSTLVTKDNVSDSSLWGNNLG